MSKTDTVIADAIARLEVLRRASSQVPGVSGDSVREHLDAIEWALCGLGEEVDRLMGALDAEVSARASAQEVRRYTYENSPFSMSIATVADGRFIDVNNAFLRRTGYTREEVIGHTSDEIQLWAPDQSREPFLEVLKTHGIVDGMEIRIRRKDGEIAHVLFFAWIIQLSGMPCILSISQNVEERRRAEMEAVRLKQFYEDLIANLPAEITILDAEGRFQYLSPNVVPDPAAREQMLNRTVHDLIAWEGGDMAEADRRHEWTRTVVERKETMQFEEHVQPLHGEAKDFIRTYKPILDERGEVARIINYAIEVTELRKLAEQFRQAQKMEAVGRLAGGVAHDFNNLLTAVMGTAELMADHLNEPESLLDAIRDVQHLAGRGASLTRQLLAFSRRQVTKPTLIDVNFIVRNMQDMIQRLIGEQVILGVDLAPGLPQVLADAHQIEQIIMNLVVNARDAMPRGGALSIRTWQSRSAARSDGDPPVQETHPSVVIVVSDTGGGIPPEILPHIFEPFFTTKEEGKGTGLGLSTVYAIAQNCGGTVTVDSSDQGATFMVHLPAALRPAGRMPVSTAIDASAPGTGTILVVEDESAVRTVVQRILTRNGYKVLTAENGDHAFQYVAQHDGAIDLLLTDMVMPGMTGRELAERVRETHPGIRVLFMSGHIENQDAQFIARQDSRSFLQKPFTAATLIRKVQDILTQD
ncbi:MAG: response regulator [Candidatus Hydrogenedentes bacterium]|nr:response regulator [Candidatus Hydrogenedentota bacterium]